MCDVGDPGFLLPASAKHRDAGLSSLTPFPLSEHSHQGRQHFFEASLRLLRTDFQPMLGPSRAMFHPESCIRIDALLQPTVIRRKKTIAHHRQMWTGSSPLTFPVSAALSKSGRTELPFDLRRSKVIPLMASRSGSGGDEDAGVGKSDVSDPGSPTVPWGCTMRRPRS